MRDLNRQEEVGVLLDDVYNEKEREREKEGSFICGSIMHKFS